MYRWSNALVSGQAEPGADRPASDRSRARRGQRFGVDQSTSSAAARVWVCLGAIVMACASPTRPPSATSGSRKPSEVITLPRTVVTPNGVASVDELYDAATADLLAGRFERAASQFDRVFS